MDRSEILRRFIKSQRAGNWFMQVQSMKKMPPNLQGGALSVHKFFLCIPPGL